MHNQTESSVSLIKVEFIFFIVSCLLAVAGCSSGKPNGVTERSEPAKTSPAPAPDFQKQHQQAEEQLRPGIEAERQKDQKEAEQALDQDAIAAIEQTDKCDQGDSGKQQERRHGRDRGCYGKDKHFAGEESCIGAYSGPCRSWGHRRCARGHQDNRCDRSRGGGCNETETFAWRSNPARFSRQRAAHSDYVSSASDISGSITAGRSPFGSRQEPGRRKRAADSSQHAGDRRSCDTTSAHPCPGRHRCGRTHSVRTKDAALTLLQTAKNEANRSLHLGYMSDDSEYKALDNEISALESAIKGTGDTEFDVLAPARQDLRIS